MNENGLLVRFLARFGFFSYLAIPQILILGVALLSFGKILDTSVSQNAIRALDEQLATRMAILEDSFLGYFSNPSSLPVFSGTSTKDAIQNWYIKVKDGSHAVGVLFMVVDSEGWPVFTDRVMPIRNRYLTTGVASTKILMANGEHANFRVLKSGQSISDGIGGSWNLVLAVDSSLATNFSQIQIRQVIILLVIFFLALLSLELLLIRQLLEPLKRLSNRMKVIGPETWGHMEPIDALPKELMQLSERFNALLARLRHAFEERNSFTEDLAHQLRTPLTVLQMQIETFRRKPRELEEYEQVLDDMGEGLDRLNQVIDSLLMVSRYESLAQLPELETFYLGDLVSDLVELFSPFAEENQLQFRLSLDAQTRLLGNGRILRQAISNLIDNALKYGVGGKYIDIQVFTQHEKSYFTIANYGPLIPREQINRIYERFFRSDRTSSTKGFGLGLAIVKQIITLHGGTIETLSDKDNGTKFFLIFPKAN